MVIKLIVVMIPIAFEQKKFLFSLKTKNPIIAVNSIGKKANFKCSNVLSFTLLNAPTKAFLLDHSNVK